MQQRSLVHGRETALDVPLPLRFVGKLVLEVLPAATASVIGAFLLAYSQFAEPPAVAAPQPAATEPAPPQMMQLLREEHLLIRDYLLTQQAQGDAEADGADAGADDVRVAADAKDLMPAARRRATVATARPPHGKGPVIAAAAPNAVSTAPAQLPPVVIAGVQPANPLPAALAAAPPERKSLFTRTLAVPGAVVGITLHAVMAIGGIPSWIGHRVGAVELDTNQAAADAAS